MLINTVIAVGAVHALYLGFLVLMKKDKFGADYVLAAYLVVLAGAYANIFFAAIYDMPDLMVFQLNINLLVAPLFFVYIRSLVQPEKRGLRFLVPHLMVYCWTWAYWFALFATHSEAEIALMFSVGGQRPLLFVIAILLEVVAIPVYVAWSWWLLRRHKHAISDAFSYIEGVDLKWANTLIYFTGLLWLGVAGVESWNEEVVLISSDESLRLGYAISVLGIFYLGYFGLKQGHIGIAFRIPDQAEVGSVASTSRETGAKYQRSGLKDEAAQDYAQMVLDYMQLEKPYLQSRLSIQDLAQGLDMPSHHLSQVINEKLNQTFYDFVNRYRVDEFKSRMAESQYQNYSVLAVALDCGFNSKSSFNRIFKNVEGCTPTEYARRIASSSRNT